ncbi:MAG: hypothetical protein JXR58_08855 [Bacteroidales bacterium]|nr:hypothetical protein [Bacteroidales bacterium]
MKRILYISVILMVLLPLITEAQKWKRIRYEAMFGMGLSNSFTDLGGADRDGTHFMRDMEMKKSQPLFFLGARYKILEVFAVKLNLNYTWVGASDELTNWPGRLNRGITSKSPIFEFSTQAEYSITKERFGSRYTFARLRNIRNLKINTYVFLGVGGVFFAPKIRVDGAWISAKDIDPEMYSSIGDADFHKLNVVIPVGIGFKYGINRLWSLGIEFTERFTTTDHLEGWSDKYSRANDSYAFMLVQLSYKLKTAKNGLPKF